MHLVGSLDPTIPLNFGLFENITVSVPRGTILNPVAPAATGVRAATAVRINDVIVGVLTRALAGLIPCPSGGTVVPVVVAERAAQSGNPVLSVIQTLVGGTGGQSGMDGIDGRDSGLANLYNTPLERSEAEVGVVIDHYGLRPDSGGPGQWRGGMGLELRLLFRKTGTSVLGRGLERFVFRPWGAAGGRPGARCQVILNHGRPDERRLGKIAELFVAPGDTLTILTAGGGGYGHPFDRDPDLVVADVLAGLVSPAQARADYGVILRGDAPDTDATRHYRATHRPDVPEIDFGPERAIWESLFDDQTATEFALRLQNLPVGSRQAVRQEILSEVLPQMSQVNAIGLAEVIGDAAAQKRTLARLIDERLPPLTAADRNWLD
jgi:N-methylhydantoinase B